jgi:hypothetical protein
MNANTMMKNFKIADSDWAAINQTPKAKAKMEACIKALLSAIDLSGKNGLDFGCVNVELPQYPMRAGRT